MSSAIYCIAAGAVERVAAPGKLRRNAPDAVPVSVIGRLAVSRSHAGQGLGADLLADTLRRIALAVQSIGIGAVRAHLLEVVPGTEHRAFRRQHDRLDAPVGGNGGEAFGQRG